MFKNLCSLVKKSTTRHTLFEFNYLYSSQRYSFIRSLKKNKSSNKLENTNLEEEDYIDEKGNKVPFVKKSFGKFPFLPIGDHPLIPLYNRMVPITKELSDALISEKLEEKRFCVSVIKNPEKLVGLSVL